MLLHLLRGDYNNRTYSNRRRHSISDKTPNASLNSVISTLHVIQCDVSFILEHEPRIRFFAKARFLRSSFRDLRHRDNYLLLCLLLWALIPDLVYLFGVFSESHRYYSSVVREDAKRWVYFNKNHAVYNFKYFFDCSDNAISL